MGNGVEMFPTQMGMTRDVLVTRFSRFCTLRGVETHVGNR